jgi:hypothetical protein
MGLQSARLKTEYSEETDQGRAVVKIHESRTRLRRNLIARLGLETLRCARFHEATSACLDRQNVSLLCVSWLSPLPGALEELEFRGIHEEQPRSFRNSEQH